MQTEFELTTESAELYEITQRVTDWTAGQGDGLLTLFVRHTSCSLLIQENIDNNVQHDLWTFFDNLVPHAEMPQMAWLTHTLEGRDDMPAHIKAAMLPTSLSIPLAEGRPLLGRYQGIFLFEHRDAIGRPRYVAAQITR